MGIWNGMKSRFPFTSKDKIVHMLPSFLFVIYSRRIYFKTLTNLLPSLKFYGKLGTAEINAKFLLQGFSGGWFFTHGICQEISIMVWALLEGVPPSRENLLQQEWRLCLQNWLWNNSEDEWMTWSQERPPRYIEEGFSSHRHLLIRNRCTESFINSWNSTLLYILIVCQCLTIRWKMPINDYNRMEDEVRKNMIPLLKVLDSKTETMDSSYDVM